MMTPMMRAKLSRNIDYHIAMRDFYTEEDKKAKEPPQSDPGAAATEPGGAARPALTRSVPRGEPGQDAPQPPKPAQSAAEKLAEMHNEVVQQLSAILEADPQVDALDRMRAMPRPLRNPGANLKPTAGKPTTNIFH
jgi:hypothetical protein